MDESSQQQPRIPGVKYKKVKMFRQETTVLAGKSSTLKVPSYVWVPVPPRDWDGLILKGVTGLVIVLTALAVAGTTASAGQLLSTILPGEIAYSVGLGFTSMWVGCLGLEWLNRVDRSRARAAQFGGGVAVLISMGTIVTYGHSIHHVEAGAAVASVELLAKGLWELLLHYHAVPLSAQHAHWLADQEQQGAAAMLLSTRLQRLNSRHAYALATGGPEYEAAVAMLASAQTESLPVVEAVPAPTATWIAPAAPAPVVAPVPVPTAVWATPAAPVAAPVPVPTATWVAPTAPAPVSAPVAPAVPVATAAPVAAPPAAPAAPVVESSTGAVTPIGAPSIAGVVRAAIGADPSVSDSDLIEQVRQVIGDRPNLPETVLRTARRVDASRRAS